MLVELVGVSHRYTHHDWVLDGVNLQVRLGDRVSIVAPSGSGKTTLASVIGGTLRPTVGTLLVKNRDVWALPGPTSSHAAWVFQAVNLFRHRSVLDNVAMGAIHRVDSWDEATTEARRCLATVGLERLSNRASRTLSGGEAQRVGLARGLCTGRDLLIADEPTANLDHRTRDIVVESIITLPKTIAVVLITHDPVVAASMEAQLEIVGSRLVLSR